MAFRFDDVSFATRTEERADGLYAYSTVCRDGILTYFRGDGKRVRELRPASANRDREFLESLKGLPMTVEHPSSLLRGKRDITVGELTKVGEYNDSEGVVQNIARISNPQFAQSVKAGKKNGLSLGYECEIVEAPNGIWFDAIDQITYRGDFDRVQTKIRPDHCAATDNPRGGSAVRMHLDSADADEDSVVELVRFDSIQVKASAPNSVVVIPKIKNEGSSAMSELKTKTLRVNALEDMLIELEVARQDSSCRDKETDASEPDDEEDEGEPSVPSKKGKKGKKMKSSELAVVLDSDEVRELIAEEVNRQTADRLEAIGKAHDLLASKGINIKDAGIETTMDASEIRRAALKAVNPNVDLSDRNDSYIEARFDSAAEYAQLQPSYADRLETAIKVGRTERKDSAEEKKNAAARNNRRYGKNYSKPLARSTRK